MNLLFLLSRKILQFFAIEKVETFETCPFLIGKIETYLYGVYQIFFKKLSVETVEKAETYWILVDEVKTFWLGSNKVEQFFCWLEKVETYQNLVEKVET